MDPKAGLAELGERIAEALEAETQPEQQLRAARAQLLERVTGGQQRALRGRAARLRYAAIAALALLTVAGAGVRSFYRPISFVTNAGELGVGDVLEAARGVPVRVEFNEGSQMLLHQSTRARVLDTQAGGARVLLESGVADVSVAHRAGHTTRWRFEAGPFQVLVKGTRFELGWQPAAQSLSLTMKSGSVEVSGGCLPSARVVERGASLHVSCASTPPMAAATATAQAQKTVVPEPSAPSLPTLPARAPAPESKAAPHGYEARCETAGKPELVAIANRERLAGHVARARTALLVLRRRFPGSSEAGTAAFTLGRMAFDQQADYGEAARWFGSYLAEQPNGPLMGDASGRLLEAHERQGDRAAARRDAEKYLQRFPDGPYAKRAKRIFAE